MDEIRNILSELEDIISDYDELIGKACGHGIYSSDEYEKMDNMRNRAYEIIQQLMVQADKR